jgi:hypothetical protein
MIWYLLTPGLGEALKGLWESQGVYVYVGLVSVLFGGGVFTTLSLIGLLIDNGSDTSSGTTPTPPTPTRGPLIPALTMKQSAQEQRGPTASAGT